MVCCATSSRITSYNVCYTKLLRVSNDGTLIVGGGLQRGDVGRVGCDILLRSVKLAAVDGIGRGGADLSGGDVDDRARLAGRARITSYNVCYTKLLRTWRDHIRPSQRQYHALR